MALINSKQLEYPLTGSFIDDGSGLTAISASSIVGLNIPNTGSFATTGSNTFKGIQTLSGYVPNVPSPAYLKLSGSNGQNIIQFFSGSSQLGNIANIDDRLIISNPHTVAKGITLITNVTGSIELDTDQVFIHDVLRVSGSTLIGSDTLTPGANEKLLIDSGDLNSYNLITARSNLNNYSQFNITNKSSGSFASTDIVITNDIGTEGTYYVDLGMNSSQFAGVIGGPNDAYLYVTGSNFLISNITPDKDLTISSQREVIISGSFSVDGNVSTFNNDLFLIKDKTTQQPVLTVTQSIVQFATQSINPTGNTQAGSIWFTSSSMYIGLE